MISHAIRFGRVPAVGRGDPQQADEDDRAQQKLDEQGSGHARILPEIV
jgi:hypothetical protein